MREGNGPCGIWVVVVCSLCDIPATFTEIPVIYLQAKQHLTLQVMGGGGGGGGLAGKEDCRIILPGSISKL